MSGSPGGSSDVGSYRAPDVPSFFEPTPYAFGKQPELFANDQVEIDTIKRIWLREVADAVDSGVGFSSLLNNSTGEVDERAGEQVREFCQQNPGNGQVVIMQRRRQLVDKLQALTSAIIQRGLSGSVLQEAKDAIDFAVQWVEKWTTLGCSFVSIFDNTQLCPCGPGERDKNGRLKASRDLQLQHLMQSHLQKEVWTLFQNPLNNTITVFQQSIARQADGSKVLTPHWRPVRAERQPGHDDHVDAARLFGIVYDKDLLGGEMQDLCNDPAKGDKAVAMLSRNYRSLRVPTCCRTLISFSNGAHPPLIRLSPVSHASLLCRAEFTSLRKPSITFVTFAPMSAMSRRISSCCSSNAAIRAIIRSSKSGVFTPTLAQHLPTIAARVSSLASMHPSRTVTSSEEAPMSGCVPRLFPACRAGFVAADGALMTVCCCSDVRCAGRGTVLHGGPPAPGRDGS